MHGATTKRMHKCLGNIYLKSHKFDKILRRFKYGISSYYSFKNVTPKWQTKEQQALAVILPVVSVMSESEQKNIIITDESFVKIVEMSVLILVILNWGVNLRVFLKRTYSEVGFSYDFILITCLLISLL